MYAYCNKLDGTRNFPCRILKCPCSSLHFSVCSLPSFSSSFFFFICGAKDGFQAVVFPLIGFQTFGILQCEYVNPTTNPQPEGPVCLSLPGISLEICPAWVALPAARLSPAWLSTFLVPARSHTRLHKPSTRWSPARGTFVYLDSAIRTA